MSTYCQQTGKAIHKSHNDAIKAVKNLSHTGSAYKCAFCKGYHHSSFINGQSRKQRISRK